MLVICSDFGDDSSVLHRNGKGSGLNRLFISGRYRGISTIVSVQKLTLVSTPIRVNATGLLSFRVRSQKEYEAIEGEVSALVGRHTFREIWEEATSEPYSFLFIRLNAPNLSTTCMKRFEQHFTFE